LDLLLAHGDDGGPMLDREADPRTAAVEAAPVPKREEKFLADITAGASDLARQGWAIVVSADAAGARLASVVKELVAARAEDQQAEVITVAVPPDLDGPAAIRWKKDVYPALYGEDEERRPRYLLILGDLDQVSLETQDVLGQDGLTGRLACEAEAGYGAYVAKVLAAEREPPRDPRARAVFYTVHDGTAATTAGHAKLIQPCHDRSARTARDKPRAFPASSVEAHGATAPDPAELLALAAARHPSVLLSMSHGMGPPRRRRWSPEEARRLQGAMSFGSAGTLAAADVASAPFLPGGMWIYFACFGAGTPRGSAYRHWLELLAHEGMAELAPVLATLREVGERGGFVSGLAKAALANPDGPLAVFGHFDLAWSYGYEELRVDRERTAGRLSGSNRSLNFYNLMTKLVAGERAGAAALAFRLQLTGVGDELTAHYDRCKRAGSVEGAAPEDLLALGNLWMLYQDLRGYALLGDPAVQLPLASAAVRAARAPMPAVELAPERTVPAPHDRGAAGADVDDATLARFEQAALAILGGASEGVAAVEHGMQRSEAIEAAAVYRDAGRAALHALLGRRE
jgi:hypothetical protein